jgi:hypothetical protein
MVDNVEQVSVENPIVTTKPEDDFDAMLLFSPSTETLMQYTTTACRRTYRS